MTVHRNISPFAALGLGLLAGGITLVMTFQPPVYVTKAAGFELGNDLIPGAFNPL